MRRTVRIPNPAAEMSLVAEAFYTSATAVLMEPISWRVRTLLWPL
jgi:hypothetical protein